MRGFIGCVLALFLGIGIGYFSRKPKEVIVEKEVVKYYPKKEIKTIELLKYIPEYVFVPSDSVRVVYKDSEPFYLLPKKSYYSSVGEVEVWHSGLYSSIDSLRVSYVQKAPKELKHTLSVGLEASYCQELSLPLSLSYHYKISENLLMGSQVGYDLYHKNFFFGVEMSLEFNF